MEIDELKKKAEQGDVDAQYKIGTYYFRSRNLNDAAFWLEQAAEQGNRESFYRLNLTAFKDNLIKDEIEKWYLPLVNQGNVAAQYYFGKFLEKSERYSEALEWLSRAANQGDLPAQLHLGRSFRTGIYGYDQNYRKSFEWFLKAAEQGSQEACRRVGWFYSVGAGVRKNDEKAIEWYKKANAYRCVGDIYNDKNDFSEALKWYTKAAETGDCFDQSFLATYLYNHEMYEEALKWEIKASEGNLDYCRAVGHYYEWGKGVEKDLDEAMRWYKKAAEGGGAGSKVFLGQKLFEQMHYEDALEWFEKVISDKEASDDTKKEAQDYIEKCQKLLNPSSTVPLTSKDEGVKNSVEKERMPNTLETLLQQLQSLIGLNKVKQEVSTLVNLLKLQSMRKQHGLPEIPMSRHLVFVGNPGTGKTTVARLLAEIYHQLGILSKGQLIEVDRSGLVAGYVGQTALKTQEAIQSALGGILFVDEAYTLAKPETPNDFGQEAIDTILKAMEDHRDDFVVIVAGYPDLMKTFITSNPGLKSRFNKYIYFQDYNPEELLDIFKSQCKNAGLMLEDGASEIAFGYLQNAYENRDSNFANGRSVRNYFERVLSNQANRLAVQSVVSETDLITLSKDDVINAAADTTM